MLTSPRLEIGRRREAPEDLAGRLAPDNDGARLNKTERAVLLEIIGSQGTLRSTLAERLGLSKPTVFAAVKRLQQAKLVVAFDTTQGSLGRPATFHRAAAEAGCCIGIDLGTTRVRVRAAAIDGRQLAAAERAVRASRSEIGTSSVQAACQLVRELGEELGSMDAPVRKCVIAAPIRVDFGSPPSPRLDPLFEAVRAMPVHERFSMEIENNVNCAAVAEGFEGAATGAGTFALLQVGVKIGLGIMFEGRLFRGGRGGAGEVSYLPYPWHEDGSPQRMKLEAHLGSAGLMARAQGPADIPHTWRGDAKALFAKAATGDPHARRLVDVHAREVGELAAAVVAMIDPPLIILSGGVGQNELLLDGVRAAVRRLTWETEVRPGLLGQQATMIGAVRLATTATLRDVLNEGS
jgi:predicted NBD/HSP70 family sugar kinase/DNA-binding CsgD family transcriptional regulator